MTGRDDEPGVHEAPGAAAPEGHGTGLGPEGGSGGRRKGPGAPPDAVPEDAVPEDAVPEDAVPEDAVPEDAVPEDAVHGGGPPPPGAPPVAAPGIARVGEAGASLGRATAVMAVGTTLSRVTGVLRLAALTYAVGTLALSDSYNLANTLPNIVQDVILGGVLSATFVPVFVHRLTTRDDEEAWEAVSAVVSVTMIVIAVASVVFLLAVPFVIDATTALNHNAQAAAGRAVAKDLLFLFVPQLTCYG
ncbi:MAG TPA: lipid II flippase MurJ, partial [Acidimicrobiales bacterium]|nr:lipid II flippase MurJ [Acidimicrobiales bacterium]